MNREDALDADTARDLTDRERLAHAAALACDAYAFESLKTLFLTFAHAHVDAQRVARAERRDVGLELLACYLFYDVHGGLPSFVSKCFNHKSGRFRLVISSACCRRHASIFLWSPESSSSGTVRPRYSAGRVYDGGLRSP